MKNEHLSDYRKNSISLEPYLSGSKHINTGNGERIASVIGGAALLYFGFQKFRFSNILMALTGAALFKRGLTGHCEINEAFGRNTAKQEGQPVIVKKSVTINRPRQEVWEKWRRLEQLPSFAKHINKVERLDEEGKQHRWEMEVPKLNRKIHWKSEIVRETPGERLLYLTYTGSDVGQAGEIIFRDAPQNRGTEMHVTIKYYPPVGAVGSSVAKLVNPIIEGVVHEDMSRFKKLLETGQIVTTEGQTSGRKEMQLTDRQGMQQDKNHTAMLPHPAPHKEVPVRKAD